MHDIIIVGGGPAGLTAAVYGLRAGKTVLVIEKAGFGGQIAFSPKVENIPGTKTISGSEFADKLTEQALLLYDRGVILYVEGVRHSLTESFDIVLSARFTVYALCDQHIYEGHYVYFLICQKQLVHRREDLSVLGQIEVGRRYRIGNIVKRVGVYENSAQKRLLGDKREGQFFCELIFHFVISTFTRFIIPFRWIYCLLVTSTVIFPLTPV